MFAHEKREPPWSPPPGSSSKRPSPPRYECCDCSSWPRRAQTRIPDCELPNAEDDEHAGACFACVHHHTLDRLLLPPSSRYPKYAMRHSLSVRVCSTSGGACSGLKDRPRGADRESQRIRGRFPADSVLGGRRGCVSHALAPRPETVHAAHSSTLYQFLVVLALYYYTAMLELTNRSGFLLVNRDRRASPIRLSTASSRPAASLL